MAYSTLLQKYYTSLQQKADSVRKPENIKYRCFLEAVRNYTISMDTGFDALFVSKNMECAIHLLRMLLDASIKTYGILLAKNPEKYLNDFLKGVHKGDYASRSDCKFDGKPLTTGNIISYMEKDGYPIKKFYEDASYYIHPSNFYCLGIKLDAETSKWLWDSQDGNLVSNYTDLRDRTIREWVYNTMCLINDLIIETMDKVKEMVEPTPIPMYIMDINSGELVPNPDYKPTTN